MIDTGDRVVKLEVEIARSAEDQRVGLMFRRSLPPNAGMAFVFPSDTDGGLLDEEHADPPFNRVRRSPRRDPADPRHDAVPPRTLPDLLPEADLQDRAGGRTEERSDGSAWRSGTGSGCAAPSTVEPGLRTVAADGHRAPPARPVARRVVEGPATPGGVAGPQAAPRAVAPSRSRPRRAGVRAPRIARRARLEDRLPVGAEPEAQPLRRARRRRAPPGPAGRGARRRWRPGASEAPRAGPARRQAPTGRGVGVRGDEAVSVEPAREGCPGSRARRRRTRGRRC